jgi:hypothetical protein
MVHEPLPVALLQSVHVLYLSDGKWHTGKSPEDGSMGTRRKDHQPY